MLYTDPWYEMRLLSNWPTDGGEFAPGTVPPSAGFHEQVKNFAPSGLEPTAGQLRPSPSFR